MSAAKDDCLSKILFQSLVSFLRAYLDVKSKSAIKGEGALAYHVWLSVLYRMNRLFDHRLRSCKLTILS